MNSRYITNHWAGYPIKITKLLLHLEINVEVLHLKYCNISNDKQDHLPSTGGNSENNVTILYGWHNLT